MADELAAYDPAADPTPLAEYAAQAARLAEAPGAERAVRAVVQRATSAAPASLEGAAEEGPEQGAGRPWGADVRELLDAARPVHGGDLVDRLAGACRALLARLGAEEAAQLQELQERLGDSPVAAVALADCRGLYARQRRLAVDRLRHVLAPVALSTMEPDADAAAAAAAAAAPEPPGSPQRRRKVTPSARRVLGHWVAQNFGTPASPSEQEVGALAIEAGLSTEQVREWLGSVPV